MVCGVLEIDAVDYHTGGEPFRIVTGQQLRGARHESRRGLDGHGGRCRALGRAG